MRIYIYFLILITFDYKERKTRWDFENDHNSFKMVREEVETHIKVLSVTETEQHRTIEARIQEK